MKAGTIVRLKNNKIATVVYNGLDGIGVKYGKHVLSTEQLEEIMSYTPIFNDSNPAPDDYGWFPDEILKSNNNLTIIKE